MNEYKDWQVILIIIIWGTFMLLEIILKGNFMPLIFFIMGFIVMFIFNLLVQDIDRDNENN